MLLRAVQCLVILALLPLAACAFPPVTEDLDSPAAGMATLGDQMLAKNDYGAAIDFYRRALDKDRKNVRALRGLAISLDRFGDKQASLAAYKHGVSQRPKDAELRRGYGKLLLALDEPAEAKTQFKAALDVDSDDVKARSGLGVALDYLGEHTKAQREYERALEDDPRNLSTISNLSYSYILLRRYDRAMALLEPELHNPAAPRALRQNLALAYGLAGMDADAMRVAKMDLPPEKVKETMDYYRRQRAEMKVDTAPYAEVGTYATEAMALAQIKKLQPQVDKTGGDLKPVVLPEVSAPGGTPRFTVRMMGCTRPDDVSKLCQTLAKAGIPCVPRGKGGE